MTVSGKKRFIAGAVCPACGALDKIVLQQSEAGTHRSCVACGFEETLSNQGAVEELATRVNTPRPGEATLPHETAVDRVKILDD